MPRSAESRPVILVTTSVVAMLLHIPIVMGISKLAADTAEPPDEMAQITSVEVIEEEPEEPAEALGQIVSLDKPDQETPPPEKAKYADRYNQKVEKETVRKREPSKPGAKAPPRRATKSRPNPRPRSKPVTTPVARKDTRPPQPKPAAAPKPSPEAPAPSSISIPDKPDQELKVRKNKEFTNAPETSKGVSRAAPANPGLTPLPPGGKQAPPSQTEGTGQDDTPTINPAKILPNMQDMLGQAGNEGSNDYLDVEEGEKDLLNRKKTRYWAYFDRMKTAVGRKWDPISKYQIHDPRRQIYGVKSRTTILSVVLNGDGSLKKIHVENPSGVGFLDDEAVRAFRAASSFPNPPEGLKDKDGLISLRFGFHLDIQTRGFRIQRLRR